jgi:NAD(P)-dependent dehydrogenase (short-subunit alcohol dehydrogenase family)
MSIRLDGRVAVVTGAGGGLGREHALLLAARGAKVVVNDVSAEAAAAVAAEITAVGGTALGQAGSVSDEAAVNAMVRAVMQAWGRIDILVNNAGILRDKSFGKMDLADFRLVLDVHVMGAAICTQAVWQIMRDQKYGRIVLTTSSSGLWGNFGQANYGAAKMALVGLMQTLSIEGEKYGIRVNCLAPTAATRMTAGLMPAEVLERLSPAAVSPAVLLLASEDAPTRAIVCAGGGTFERAYVTLTPGLHLGLGDDVPERLAEQWQAISERSGEMVPESGSAQGTNEVSLALKAGR